MFKDRRHAGLALARAVRGIIEHDLALERSSVRPVALALPRGGVPVAYEVSRELSAQLDLVLVRKVGLPWAQELAAAAVVDGETPTLVRNDRIIERAGLTRAELEHETARELEELERRRSIYLRDRPRADLTDALVIVVDDGVATGATAKAAIKALAGFRPAQLVFAVPVAAYRALADIADTVDRFVCLRRLRPGTSVGDHYESFDQLTDQEVVALLDASTSWVSSPEAALMES